jgi:hypothetical protein
MPASYRDLAATQLLTAAADLTGANPYGTGKWTITFGPEDLGFRVGQAEVYQATVDGPVGSSFQMWRNVRLWNVVAQGWANNYDPQQPMLLRYGDTVSLYWNSTGTPKPTAILWLRYDTSLPENQQGG